MMLCRKSSGGGVPGQGDVGTGGKGGEVPVCPVPVILARWRWGVSVRIPPSGTASVWQNGSVLSAAELHHVCSTVPLLACSAQTTATAGMELFFFFFFISHKMELDPRYRGNQQP